jgi:hypothetical protein
MSNDLRHRNTSFSYKTIHPDIRVVLDARANLNNTIQVGMPFIKATTTLDLYQIFGDDYAGCVGFSLGTHMYLNSAAQGIRSINIEETFSSQWGAENSPFVEILNWEDMYSSTSDGEFSPLIGYTHSSDGVRRVYARRSELAKETNTLLELNTPFEDDVNSSLIAPPGITNVTIGSNRNGLISSAQLSFSVPHLLQLEALHRTFLVPGAGMVIEWGQKFAPELTPSYGEYGPIEEHLFPWDDALKLGPLLRRLGKKQVSRQEILDCYVYPTQGQYNWMFGRVANFNVKSNSDGSYECSVKVVGPAEDSWAYTTTNTIVPGVAYTGDRNNIRFCPDNTNSIYSYFNDTEIGLNLSTLVTGLATNVDLDGISEAKKNFISRDPAFDTTWGTHVIRFNKGNKSTTEKKDNETGFANSQDAYYISWRFFVNVVLNDEIYGLKAIFKRAGLTPQELDKVAILRPYTPDGGGIGDVRITDPLETYVGYSKFLRSVDISKLIIVNETAVKEAKAYLESLGIPTRNIFREDDIYANFLTGKGTFNIPLTPSTPTRGLDPGDVTPPRSDAAFLSTGVWINHKALVEAMLSSQTLVGGITNLLNMMNVATQNYWRLTLDPLEPLPPAVCGQTADTDPAISYQIIDANYRDNSQYAVQNFITGQNRVHIFNKYIRESGNQRVGSDLLEASVTLDLPKRLFSQIATLGLVQPSDVDNLQNDGSTNENTQLEPILSGPDQALRKMFSITSIATGPNGVSVDLTYSNEPRTLTNGTCGATDVAPPGGQGAGTAPLRDVDDVDDDIDAINEQIKNFEETDAFSGVCTNREARRIYDSVQNPTESPTASAVPTGNLQGFVKPVKNYPVNSSFRSPNRPNHAGVDIAAPTGTPVYASFEGRVVDLLNDPDSETSYGTYIIIEHPNGFKTRYAHLSAITSNLKIGDSVTTNQEIGKVGNTGGVIPSGGGDGSHLHFEILAPTGTPVDPAPVFVTSVPAMKRERLEELTPEQRNTYQTFLRECSTYLDLRRQKSTLEAERERIEARNTTIQSARERIDSNRKRYGDLNSILRYHEMFPDWMVANITHIDSDGIKSNAFGAAPGTLSIAADLVMPGIAGLRVGELFWIDRIPTFYRAFGAFQVISIEDTIGLDGWKTKIHSRFNYLGTLWKEQMFNILSGRTVLAELTTTNTSPDPSPI